MAKTATQLSSRILTPIVDRFINDWVTTITSFPGDPPLKELKHMMRYDPVSGLSARLTNLAVIAAMGEFAHPKKRIEKFVQKSIAQARGNWAQTQEGMLSFIYFGHSFTEKSHEIDGKANLKEFRTIDPEYYFYEGSKGEITNVVYRARGTTDIKIQYADGIHLVNEPYLCFGDPVGISAAARAYPYWKLHQILMPILSIASQRQATPILIYKTDTGSRIEILDEYGQPITNPATGDTKTTTKGQEAIAAIEALESSGAMAIDLDEDVIAVNPAIAEKFLQFVLKTCEQYRMMSFLVPSTIASFSSSGVGDAGLAESQRETFEKISAARAQQLGDAIVEQCLKPLIIFNFGEQDSYGEFPVNTRDPMAIQVAEVVTQAVQRGAFTAEDETVVDRLKDLLGVEENPEFKAMQKERRATQQQSNPQPTDPNQNQDGAIA